jgi:N-glycosylase/DNA lyase
MTRQRALLSETLATIRSEVLESNQFTVEVPSAWTQIARVDEIEPLLRNNLFWSIVRSRLTGRRVEPVTNLVEEVQSLVKASILFPEMSGC